MVTFHCVRVACADDVLYFSISSERVCEFVHIQYVCVCVSVCVCACVCVCVSCYQNDTILLSLLQPQRISGAAPVSNENK